MQVSDWIQFHGHILQLEQKGLVTRPFRRLDPERKEAIIGAILEEAVEKGPAAINIKKVAERADVSVGSLYTYFGNRDGLLAFAMELCGRYLNDELNSFGPYLVNLPLREGLTWYMKGGLGQIPGGTGPVFCQGGLSRRSGVGRNGSAPYRNDFTGDRP